MGVHSCPTRRSWALIWLSTTLFVLRESAGVHSTPVWTQVSTPIGVGVRSALSYRKRKTPLTPSAHASTHTTTDKHFGYDWVDEEGQVDYAYRSAVAEPEKPVVSVARKVRSEARNTGVNSESPSAKDLELCSLASAQNQKQLAEKVILNKEELAEATTTSAARGGSATAISYRPLMFWENMVAGAVSRSIAQTVMQPANTMKTILQADTTATIGNLAKPKNFLTLTRGAGANFLLSVPHGAVNFAVLEMVRARMDAIVQSTPSLAKRAERIGPGLDFVSSAISTICCSVVSTPQMMITDNIMAGNYPNLPDAVVGLARERGFMGFYAGWWPGLAGKIPSYALTWTLFQELKSAHRRIFNRPAGDLENSVMGCFASATTVCIMIPMDTIKTRLVTQATSPGSIPYKGITDCAIRIFKEEGIRSFYRGLPPRLVSVVPMIGIQFGVYEFMKKTMVTREANRKKPTKPAAKGKFPTEQYGRTEALEEAAMEVAADDDQPFPAPHFRKR